MVVYLSSKSIVAPVLQKLSHLMVSDDASLLDPDIHIETIQDNSIVYYVHIGITIRLLLILMS